LYEAMERKINAAVELGGISEDIRKQHKGFSEWSSVTTSRNHPAIVQVDQKLNFTWNMCV